MGQNSTEVAYGFGQMGSVFTNLAAPVYPPKDHVIIAIQCLADSTFSVLETETLDTMGPQFLTHQDDELATAGGPDANYLGVVEAAKEMKIDIPLVVRLAGTNYEKGKKILDDSKLKIISASDLSEAAKKVVEITK